MLKKISDRLIRLISKNFGWKLFSVVCATILWFVVMNIINPTEIQTYSVNITFANEDKLTEKGFVIMNKEEIQNTKIDIKVKSTRAALDELSKNKNEITATVDLKQFAMLYADDTDEAFKVVVTPNIPTSYVYTYELVSYTPGEVSIKLDNIVEDQKEVSVESEGTLSSGYLAESPDVIPSVVTIKGASSEIQKVDSVKVFVDVNDVSQKFSKQLTPVAYDKDGNELTSIIIEPDTIQVSFGIYKYSEISVEKPTIEGNIPDGYEVSNIEWSPKTIEVVGDEKEISKIGAIKPVVKLNGETDEEITKKYDVNAHIAKNRVSIKSGTEKEVTVKITLEKEEEREISINKDSIKVEGIATGKTANVLNDITVKLKGKKENLENLNTNDIVAKINVSNFSDGENSANVSFELPEGVGVDDNVTVRVEVASQNGNQNNNSNMNEEPQTELPVETT